MTELKIFILMSRHIKCIESYHLFKFLPADWQNKLSKNVLRGTEYSTRGRKLYKTLYSRRLPLKGFYCSEVSPDIQVPPCRHVVSK